MVSRRLSRVLDALGTDERAVSDLPVDDHDALAALFEGVDAVDPLTHIEAALGRSVLDGGAAVLPRARRLRVAARMLLRPPEVPAPTVERSWLVSLDRLEPAAQAMVVQDPAQRAAWAALYAMEEVHPTLLVDSRLFPALDLSGRSDGVLVHGDGAAALDALELPPLDAVVIDPPYNTGNDHFPYDDDRSALRWVAMMRRLIMADHARLAPTGSLVVHIDEHEHVRLDRLLAEVFGRRNVVGPIVWDKRNPKGDATGIAVQHEHLAWALRDAATVRAAGGLRRPKANAEAMLGRAADEVRRLGVERARPAYRAWLRSQPFSAGERAYSELDAEGAPYRPVSMAWPSKKPAPPEYFRPLVHPTTGLSCPVPARGWRNPPGTMDALVARGDVLFGVDHTTQPTRKYRLADNRTERVPSLLYHGGSDDDLLAEMGLTFPTPKPVRVASYICSITVPPGGIVLDHFAGSGTTAHAVIELNRADVGSRRFVLIEAADTFERVLLPRIARATFASRWRGGRPDAPDALSVRYEVVRLGAPVA
jgi:adenine-specific DNA-methyltransferase